MVLLSDKISNNIEDNRARQTGLIINGSLQERGGR